MHRISRASLTSAADDRGNVAVLTAVFAVVIFGIAAFAVELTDVYSRNRAVRTVADLAAYAGAQGLPDACNAFEDAFDNLDANRGENIRGGPGGDAADDDLNDGQLANGEIQVFSAFPPELTPAQPLPTLRGEGGWLDTSSCTQGGTEVIARAGRYVRVLTPPAGREYAFGGAFEDAPDSVEIQRSATVGITSPAGIGSRLLPVFMPDGCGVGQKQLVVGPVSRRPDYDPLSDDEGPTTSVLASATDDTVVSDAIYGPSEIDGAGTLVLHLLVTDLAPGPEELPVVFDLHQDVGLGTTRVPTAPEGLRADFVSDGPDGAARYTLALDHEVTSRPGEWQIRAGQPPAVDEPPAYGPPTRFTIEGELADDGRCEGSDLGVLRVARTSMPEDALDLTAFTEGALPPPLTTDPTQCPGDDDPKGALRDDLEGEPVPGANCIRVDPGHGAGADILTQALVTGEPGVDGRLEVPDHRPPSDAPPTCRNPTGASDWSWATPVPGGHRVVNTVLSCYLDSGKTLADVRDGQVGTLRPEIFQDPRFFFVPVLHGTQRPGSAGSYAISEFRAAFLTTETVDGGRHVAPEACLSTDTSCNGIQFGTGLASGQVVALTAFVFPVSALPTEITQSVNGDTYIAGTADFVLVE